MKKVDENKALCVVDDARIIRLPNGRMADRVSFWQYNQKGEREVHKSILLRTDGISVLVGLETTLGKLREKAYDEQKATMEKTDAEKQEEKLLQEQEELA